MTHTSVFIHPKTFWLSVLIVPITIIFQKIKKELGDLIGSEDPTSGKILEPCFQLSKINNFGQFKRSQRVYLSAKGRRSKQNRQSGILFFKMLKTLDSYLYMKPNLVKNQLWISSSTSVKGSMK